MSEHDNLERFFQKAAKEPDVEFNESDWRKLEERLDAEAFRSSSARPNRWRSGSAAVGIILFFTGITYFFLPGSDLYKLTDAGKDSRIEAISKKKITETADSVGKQTAGIASSQGNPIPSITKSTSAAETRTFPVEHGKGTFNHGSQDIPSQRVGTSKDMVESVSPVTNHEAPPQEPVKNRVSESRLLERKGYSPAEALSSKDSITVLPAEHDKPAVENTKMITGTDSVVNSQKTIAPARWSMVLLFAPDFSSTGSSQFTAPGAAFGFVAHYHLRNTFSISTGLIRSHKQYWSYGNENKTPKGYWNKNTNGIIPETMYGTCNVLEIPLALQYKVAKMKKSRLFITAGLWSYLMLDESYHFTFENPNPGAKEDWYSSRPSQFLFSIANVSTGYERNILPNVAVGIEPYVKIPLTGIGWSGIKLLSMGASVTLRYSIRKKTN
jgi:hypothetical protein